MSKNMDVAQNKMNKWLKDMSLKNVTFTINSYDWLYSNAYDIARHAGDKNQMEHVQNEYLEYLSRVFDYYEETSQRMYDRKIPQTFGLEPSRIVADSLDLILEMIKKRGYEFISMDEALNDEAFQTIDGFGGHSSFFDSARLRRKQPDEKFVLPQKPKAHEDVMKAWYKEGANN